MIDMFSVHHSPKGEPYNIDQSKFPIMGEIRPIQVYIKPDGSMADEACFCFLHQAEEGAFIISQISAQMFRPFYEELKKIYEEDA